MSALLSCESATGSGGRASQGDVPSDFEDAAAADAPSVDVTAPDDEDVDVGIADTAAEADTGVAAVDAREPIALETPPLDEEALLTWLTSGTYEGWDAEAQAHPSSGPHFGTVRTFVNGGAERKDGAQFPIGTTFVKELYGQTGAAVLGWSVMVRTTDAPGGSGWWWYERYGDSVYAASQGAGLCTGCHAAGQDFVLTPYPF